MLQHPTECQHRKVGKHQTVKQQNDFEMILTYSLQRYLWTGMNGREGGEIVLLKRDMKLSIDFINDERIVH
jgi:hypothetical protein